MISKPGCYTLNMVAKQGIIIWLLDTFSCLLILFLRVIGPVGLSQMTLCLKGLGPHCSLQAIASIETPRNHYEKNEQYLSK